MLEGLKKKLAGFKENIRETVEEREIKEKEIEKLTWDLEVSLLENDVALSVVEEIISSVKERLIGEKRRRSKIEDIVEETLKDSILRLISTGFFDFDAFVDGAKRPTNIVFVGVNGTGKTTCIAKMAYMLLNRGYSVVIASGDTYRSGATEQIEEHANRLGVKLIKHHKGSDPAAVVYDAINYAKAKHTDIILADTAGRVHTNINLMDQLKKICRVTHPDLILFVDEAIAGNDAVERAKRFDDAVGIDASILTKMDADAKGGAAISISYITGKPIIFFGTGQNYDDLVKFDPDWFVDKIFA
jgi:fused signal recognition particle receptor